MKKLFILIVLLAILTGCQDVRQTAVGELSNKTIGWGFRRTESGPEFTEEQKTTMNKYGCIYRENTNAKTLYLTFDEGYENGYTGVILDVLRQKGVKAAFFVTAPYVKENPDLIKRMAREGHIIGNHTVNHPSMPTVKDDEELKKELFELDRLVYGICRHHTRYLRPPKGEYSERTLALIKSYGYTNVFWSDAYVDWNNNVSREKAHDTVTKSFHSGEVILLHAVSKGNADALGDIIDTAHKKGFEFKSLDEYSFN